MQFEKNFEWIRASRQSPQLQVVEFLHDPVKLCAPTSHCTFGCALANAVPYPVAQQEFRTYRLHQSLVTADDARQAESSEGQKLLPTFDGRPVELLAEGDFIKPQSLIAPCGFQFLDPEFIDHAFACDRFTGFTHVHRHNLVMDCLLAASKAYGIQATAEPNFYTYDDDEGKGKACRPDITFHTTPPLATDITVVSPQYIVDQAASVAATMKVKKHRAACEKMGHLFEPFPLEIQGHMNQCCDRVLSEVERLASTFETSHSRAHKQPTVELKGTNTKGKHWRIARVVTWAGRN